ncbi:unnamed protein product [Haemonchus placei]|uniref:SCP domain-containing protein n=1 Tax=Haemonchus placei TaxID=6290 RepID=A0A0N4W808_HAEPC|nr:unnamed protein product [Haemonchus placei]
MSLMRSTQDAWSALPGNGTYTECQQMQCRNYDPTTDAAATAIGDNGTIRNQNGLDVAGNPTEVTLRIA